MLIGEGWAQRVFGHRIEPLGPDAKISIARGGEIQRVPIRRELRLIVPVSSIGDSDPFRLAAAAPCRTGAIRICASGSGKLIATF